MLSEWIVTFQFQQLSLLAYKSDNKDDRKNVNDFYETMAWSMIAVYDENKSALSG